MGERVRYDAIDGLRAFSAIGIVLMHVLANGEYNMDGFVFERLIPSFTNLVFLFMVISSFAMCCGYYDKILHNQVSVEDFYKKRYGRIWPYFALLCLMDVCISPSAGSIYEMFANLTLCFGFLPNAHMEVIGVGWFLGLIFVFYVTFPFFCFLLSNKRRAWFAFAVALVFNYLCEIYFGAGRSNISYSAVYFMAGGLIFLYRDELSVFSARYRWGILLLCGTAFGAYFLFEGTVTMLVLYSILLIFAIGGKNAGGWQIPLPNF